MSAAHVHVKYVLLTHCMACHWPLGLLIQLNYALMWLSHVRTIRDSSFCFGPGFVRDEFTTLPETTDRLFCTQIYCKYQYSVGDLFGVDFNGAWYVGLFCEHLSREQNPFKIDIRPTKTTNFWSNAIVYFLKCLNTFQLLS